MGAVGFGAATAIGAGGMAACLLVAVIVDHRSCNVLVIRPFAQLEVHIGAAQALGWSVVFDGEVWILHGSEGNAVELVALILVLLCDDSPAEP